MGLGHYRVKKRLRLRPAGDHRGHAAETGRLYHLQRGGGADFLYQRELTPVFYLWGDPGRGVPCRVLPHQRIDRHGVCWREI